MTGQGQAEGSIPYRVQKVQNGSQCQRQRRQGSVIQCGVARYRMAGRVRVSRMVKTGKNYKTGTRTDSSSRFHKNGTNWQQTNREHVYKYTGDNGEDWRHLEGDGDKHKDR